MGSFTVTSKRQGLWQVMFDGDTQQMFIYQAHVGAVTNGLLADEAEL